MPDPTAVKPCSVLRRLAVLGILLMAWGLFLYRLNDVPPGLQHDQVFNILDAIDVLHGRHRIYFPANFGREPVFVYTVVAVYRLLGLQWIWGLRFSSVLWGMIGLAAAVSLGRRYLNHRAVLVAAFLLGGSFWLLFTARVGMEPICALTLSTLSVYLLARGLDRKSWRILAVAGLPAGVAIYTYLSARAFLILPLILIGYELIRWLGARAKQRSASNGRPDSQTGAVLLGLTLSWLLTIGISLPLFLYLRADPGGADGRLAELGGPIAAFFRGDFGPVLRTSWETLLALLWADHQGIEYHYNVPGRPALPVIWAILFIIGMITTLPKALRQRREFLLIVVWILGMAPALLSPGGPLYDRAIIALPLVALLTARGLSDIRTAILMRVQGGRFRSRISAGLTIVIIALGAWYWVDNVNAYFHTWAEAKETHQIYNADLRAAAVLLNNESVDQPVYISTDYWLDLDQQTYLFYRPARQDVVWFYGPKGFPLPDARGGRYVWTASASNSAPPFKVFEQAGSVTEVVDGSSGGWSLVNGTLLSQANAREALRQLDLNALVVPLNYGSPLQLLAASAKLTGPQVEVISHWEVAAPWDRSLPPKISAVLIDDTGYTWSQTDEPLAVAYQQWQKGQQFLQVSLIKPPADMPPGSYHVLLRIYDEAQGKLVIRRGGQALAREPSATEIEIGPLNNQGNAPTPPFPLRERAAAALQILGSWEQPGEMQAGVPVNIHVSWQASTTLDTQRLRFRLEAVDPANGASLWEQEAAPIGALPSIWPAGQVWRLTHRLDPESPTDGARQAELRLCAWHDGSIAACGVIVQTQVTRRPMLLNLATPPQHASGAQWGNLVQLVGYDLSAVQDEVQLTLYWRALEPASQPLLRFVHAVDSEDRIIAQADGVPGGANVEMNFWRPGEYVVDQIVLRVPGDGDAIQRLYVGLYDPASGDRVPVQSEDGVELTDRRMVISLSD